MSHELQREFLPGNSVHNLIERVKKHKNLLIASSIATTLTIAGATERYYNSDATEPESSNTITTVVATERSDDPEPILLPIAIPPTEEPIGTPMANNTIKEVTVFQPTN